MPVNIDQKDLTTTSLQNTTVKVAPTTFRPSRPLIPIGTSLPGIIKAQPITTTVNPTTQTNTAGVGGVPLPLLSVTAVQTPVKNQSLTNCNVTVSFTRNSADVNYDHVNIFFLGYHGGTNPVLVASGASSPLNFICDATKETVTVIAQTASSTGLTAPLQFAATTTVTLSGIVGAPPAPTISQALVGTPTGYQFGFNQVVLPAGDEEVISAYNVYRNTNNSFGTAFLRSTIAPNPALSGSITYSDSVNDASGNIFYYWVSAVNTAGFESTPTPAQSGIVVGSVGSLPPSISTPFTMNVTSTSVTITTSPSCFFTRADGTVVMIGQTTQAVTGLPTGNDVFFFPYWRESDQTLQYVLASDINIPPITGVKNTAASSQYVETTTSASLSSFSVELWMKGTAAGALFDHSAPQLGGVTTSSVVQCQATSAGEVELSIHGASAWVNLTTAGASVLDGCWHHVVCTYNSATTTASIYVDGFNTSDGVTLWTSAAMGTIAGTAGFWHLGFVGGLAGAPLTSDTYNSFTLSHFSLYASAISGIQASSHQQAFANLGETVYASELTYDSATNLWKLSDTSGSAADSIGTNTGTYIGSPTLAQSSSVVTVLGTPQMAFPYNSFLALQAQNLRNRTPLSAGALSAATSIGGGTQSGGGSSGGYNPQKPGKPGCFTAETRVMTRRGDIPIKDVKAGDQVRTASGEWRPVLGLQVHEAEVRTMFNLPESGASTFSHKMLVNKRWWVPIGQLFPTSFTCNEPVYCLSVLARDNDPFSPTTQHSFTLSNGIVVTNATIIKNSNFA